MNFSSNIYYGLMVILYKVLKERKSMKKKSIQLLFYLMTALFFTACNANYFDSLYSNTAPQTISTHHQLRSIQGQTIHIKELSNGFLFPQFNKKIVILQVFGKNCHFCFEEMPIIHELYSKYRYQLGVIAIQAQDPMSRATAVRLMKQYRMNYPIIERDNASNLLSTLRSRFNWSGILPFTLIIKNGMVEYYIPGKISNYEFEDKIKSIL